jgi:hypothetical protein
MARRRDVLSDFQAKLRHDLRRTGGESLANKFEKADRPAKRGV